MCYDCTRTKKSELCNHCQNCKKCKYLDYGLFCVKVYGTESEQAKGNTECKKCFRISDCDNCKYCILCKNQSNLIFNL